MKILVIHTKRWITIPREIRGGRSYPLKIMKMWITQSQGVNIRISSGKTVQNLGKQMFLSTRYAPR